MKMLAALAAISMFPRIVLAEDSFKLESAAAIVGGAHELSDKACRVDESLNFAFFRFALKGDPSTEMRFRYISCSRTSPGKGQPAVETRFYAGDHGYDLVIASDEGAARSRVSLLKASGGAGLGEVANDKLAGHDPIELGTVTIPDPGNPKLKKTGAGVLERVGLRGSPTDHRCDPATGYCGA